MEKHILMYFIVDLNYYYFNNDHLVKYSTYLSTCLTPCRGVPDDEYFFVTMYDYIKMYLFRVP